MARRILIVDDERSITDSLTLVLLDAGYETRGVCSASQALAESVAFKPDLLLTDVLMPKMNGFELALQVKAKLQNCRVLLFSGQAATVELARRYQEQFTKSGYRYELLPKPLHPSKLIQKVEESFLLAA